MIQLPGRLFELVDPGDNLLLLHPPFVAAGSKACLNLLTSGQVVQNNVLAVTYTKTPHDLLVRWKHRVRSCPAEAAIINVTADTRSTASETTDGSPAEQWANVTVEHVSSPSDLTNLGVAITNQLDKWHAEKPARQTVACFHSVTSLLQYVKLEQAVKFLDVVTSKFTDADAIAHFHMDPGAHDDQTIKQLIPLFDVVCEYADHEWARRPSH